MTTLSGKRVLVTGAGTGIGKAIAIELAASHATIIVCGRTRSPLEQTVSDIKGAGGSAQAHVCDVSNPDAVVALADHLNDEGGIDILINNAGFSSRIRSARYIQAKEWSEVMDVNTLGPAMLTRALLPPMVERGCGHVVMISSMAAIRPGVMAGAVYSAAKSAARAYMEVLSAEVRGLGVRCTTVLPGEVDTPILDNRALPPDTETRALMMQPEDISAAVLMAVSLPQRANVTEIALTATTPRDMTADVTAASNKQPQQD